MTSRAGRGLRVFYVTMIICVALSAYAVHSANQKSVAVCKRTELIKTFAVQLANRSNASLTGNAYYAANPEALQRAKLANNYVIHVFHPQPCDPGLFGLF